jgi:hypothetical protein
MKPLARITGCCIAVLALQFVAVAVTIPDQMNLEPVGHSTLNGAGKDGEGLALKQYGSRKPCLTCRYLPAYHPLTTDER